MYGGRYEMLGRILRFPGNAALPTDGRGNDFLVGVFPSWQDLLAVPATFEKSLFSAGIRPQLENESGSAGSERPRGSSGQGTCPEAGCFTETMRGDLPLYLLSRRVFAGIMG